MALRTKVIQVSTGTSSSINLTAVDYTGKGILQKVILQYNTSSSTEYVTQKEFKIYLTIDEQPEIMFQHKLTSGSYNYPGIETTRELNFVFNSNIKVRVVDTYLKMSVVYLEEV